METVRSYESTVDTASYSRRIESSFTFDLNWGLLSVHRGKLHDLTKHGLKLKRSRKSFLGCPYALSTGGR
jgi:hypothetical protein